MLWCPDPHSTLNNEIRETAERRGIDPGDLITEYVRNGIVNDKPLELFPH